MPAQLPRDGCRPACAPDHPLTRKRHHLPCTPPAVVDGPGHRCRQSGPQFQRLEQNAPGAKNKKIKITGKYVATTLVEQNLSHKDAGLTENITHLHF